MSDGEAALYLTPGEGTLVPSEQWIRNWFRDQLIVPTGGLSDDGERRTVSCYGCCIIGKMTYETLSSGNAAEFGITACLATLFVFQSPFS